MSAKSRRELNTKEKKPNINIYLAQTPKHQNTETPFTLSPNNKRGEIKLLDKRVAFRVFVGDVQVILQRDQNKQNDLIEKNAEIN